MSDLALYLNPYERRARRLMRHGLSATLVRQFRDAGSLCELQLAALEAATDEQIAAVSRLDAQANQPRG